MLHRREKEKDVRAERKEKTIVEEDEMDNILIESLFTESPWQKW